MNWEAIGAIGEVFGAVGVIASLAYLAVQIRRGDQTTRVNSLQALWDGARDRSFTPQFSDAEVGDLWARGLTNFDALGNSEKRRFFYFMAEHTFQLQQALDLFRAGLIPESDYQAWLYYTATLLQTPGGKGVWPYMQNTGAPETRDALNRYIEDNPDTPSWLELNPFFREESGGALER